MDTNNVQQPSTEGDPLARAALRASFDSSAAAALELGEHVERMADAVERLDLATAAERPHVSCNHERAGGIFWLPDHHHQMHAMYRHASADKHRSTLEIVAVNVDGDPLVWGRQGLVPAHTAMPGYWFEYIQEGKDQYVTTLPGGGWMAEHREDDGSIWVEPVVAWLIDRWGYGAAAFTDSDGEVAPERSKARIFHPDECSAPADPA